MEGKVRLLWSGKDHPMLASGYGLVTRHLLPYLGDKYGRENVFIFAPVYQRDWTGEFDGMRVLPGNSPDFDERMAIEHYGRYSCNILLQLGDAWPLGFLPDAAAKGQVTWVQWLPVDWLGMPKNIKNRLYSAWKLVPFSKYGEEALRQGGLTNVDRAIWLGLDLDLWKPQSRVELPKMMDLLGFKEDTFNVLLMGANQERKRLRQQIEAVSLLVREELNIPIRLYVHSMAVGDRDLRADADELGLNGIMAIPEPYLISTGGIPEEEMVMMFNCADVVLDVCQEGFGYGMVQAQACGVPVVCMSEGSGPELVVYGAEVPPINYEVSYNQMSQALPSSYHIAEALKSLWEERKRKGTILRSEAAVNFVQKNFGWANIANQWIDVIDRVFIERDQLCEDPPRPSEELYLRAQKLNEVR